MVEQVAEPDPDAGPDARPDVGSRVEVLGIRHHGPGSARSMLAALAELDPDLVMIEGAPELDALVASAGDADLVPPVAALVYAVDAPRRSSFYPMAMFSPEWVALRWAVARGVPVRFADLPAVHLLAEHEQPGEAGEPDEPDDEGQAGDEGDVAPEQGLAVGVRVHRPDAIAMLARIAGYDDPERWWEDAVEHRSGSTASTLATFAEIRAAMSEVRATVIAEDPDILVREAWMRRVLRAALKDGSKRIAFVCGAYHAPTVHPDSFPPVSRDNKLISVLPRGLPKSKVAVTWAPWTAGRLAVASGYGAGVTSPGWYQHLFVTWQAQDAADRAGSGAPRPDVVAGWLTRVARALRDEGLDAAPATVVEAVRMADALAAVRSRPSVGLAELTDATQSVLCEGSTLPLALIERRLVIGEELGSVPDWVPLTPLAQDLTRTQRSLRLKPSATPATIVLDLRKDAGRDRSVLLHRLRLLGVPWGRPADAGGSSGTFKEAWELVWEPELTVAVIEAGLYGTTIVDAAEARVAELAFAASDLAMLGRYVEACLTADLPRALVAVVETLAERTARQHDTRGLLEAVEPLARTQRYGDVRGADTSRVAGVLDTVVARAAVGLRAACASLDDDAAVRMREAVDAAHRGIALLDVAALSGPWRSALVAVAADEQIHGLVSGRVNRLLLDAEVLDSDEVGRRLSRRLSLGAAPLVGAAWLDGFLEGDATLLLHDRDLLALVDGWVAEVDETTFEDLLPLLRRTFSRFEAAERRQLGTRLSQGDTVRVDDALAVDWGRGLPATLRVADLLGLIRVGQERAEERVGQERVGQERVGQEREGER